MNELYRYVLRLQLARTFPIGLANRTTVAKPLQNKCEITELCLSYKKEPSACSSRKNVYTSNAAAGYLPNEFLNIAKDTSLLRLPFPDPHSSAEWQI